ncbi:MAG: hypothetical protein ACKO9Z_19185 [Planctomycetota bacterium]
MKSAFLVMTSLWLSGSVSAAETLPVVQVGHHAQAPAGKGQDAAKGGDAKGKAQDPAKGKGQAPQAPCHGGLNFLDKLKARLGDLNLGRKCSACDSKAQAPAGKGQDAGKGGDAKGKGQDAAKGGDAKGKGQDAAKGGDSKGKGQDAAKGKGQAPQAPCHECKLNMFDKLKARLGSMSFGKCNSCEVSHKGQAPAGKGQDGKGQDAGKGGKGDSKGAAPMPAKATPAKQVSTPVPAIPDLKNPF